MRTVAVMAVIALITAVGLTAIIRFAVKTDKQINL